MRLKTISPFIIVLIVFLPIVFIPKDQSLLFINGMNSSLNDFFFKNITRLGEGIMIVICIIALSFKKYKWFFTFLIAVIIHVVLIQVNKQLLFNGLHRPFVYMDEINKQHLLHFVDGVLLRHRVTFPSGHTTHMAFTCTFLALLINRKRVSIFLALLAFIVGISRVYLAQHFFIDIYFGYLFGILSSVCAYLIISKLTKKYQWMDGSLMNIIKEKLKTHPLKNIQIKFLSSKKNQNLSQ